MNKILPTLMLMLAGCSIFSQSLNVGKKATQNITRCNAAENNIVLLDGEWELYAGKLLTPSDFKRNSTLIPDTLVKPGSWNDLKTMNSLRSGKGCATYRLLLTGVPRGDLMLDAYSVQTSCRVFVNDSLVLEVGKPGTTKETTEPMNRDVQVHLPPNVNEIQLTVQIANFHHRKGGFVHPFEVGQSNAILRHHTLFYLLDVTESSVLLILGFFLFALYIFRRKDLSILYFALFCISLSFRPVIAVNYFLATAFPGFNWNILLKLEYFGVLFPCLFMVLFIKKLFPKQLPDIFVTLFSCIFFVMIAITLIFPPSVFSWLIPPLLFIIPFGVLVLAITIIRAVRAKVEGANYAGLGIIVLLGSLILKVMVYASILPVIYVLITALDIAFIFMMSLILGARFSLQFTKVEQLQHKTELQRREIEHKKDAIEEQNKHITDSINYAKRIQTSMLPTEKYIEKKLNTLKKNKDKQ